MGYNEEVKKGHPRMYQGVMALTDCFDDYTGTTGGFKVCPNSAVFLDEWCKVNRRNDKAFNFYPGKEDPWYKRLQRVPLKKGQLVIFDTGSLHANFCNKSD